MISFQKKALPVFIIVLVLFGIVFFDKSVLIERIKVNDAETQMKFDPSKWQKKKGWGYAYRNEMLADVMTDSKIRGLKKDDLMSLLGTPNRINDNYLYYTIDQKRAIILPTHTKTLVIKYSIADTIEWMKIHE